MNHVKGYYAITLMNDMNLIYTTSITVHHHPLVKQQLLLRHDAFDNDHDDDW